MGRSVSYATGSTWVTYVHLDYDEGRIFFCRKCDHEHERDDDTEPDECEECGNVGFTSDERYPAWLAWDDFIGNLKAGLKDAFPSLYDDDGRWFGSEDHVLLSNAQAHIGVSEYCGLVSVWCRPREAVWTDNAGTEAMRERWCASIEKRALRVIDEFATRLVKVGTFSNGEAVFNRAT